MGVERRLLDALFLLGEDHTAGGDPHHTEFTSKKRNEGGEIPNMLDKIGTTRLRSSFDDMTEDGREKRIPYGGVGVATRVN